MSYSFLISLSLNASAVYVVRHALHLANGYVVEDHYQSELHI